MAVTTEAFELEAENKLLRAAVRDLRFELNYQSQDVETSEEALWKIHTSLLEEAG